MAPPNANPVDRVSGDGALRRLPVGRPNQTFAVNSGAQLVSQLETARANLDRLTEQLKVVADWKDDLQQQIARRQLIFELAAVGGEQNRLIAEVECFKRCCKALAWRGAP
jgi:hypothetical protein